ncbi:methyltransferase domain-containing protein [Paenibacillus kobensis]|uniref:methyltransferase domain-containing protein n=1 Tax=Paenibacillus kobensis TaxID=59841 RepID=UPI0013E32B17|nr:methyltransferase domain-containing protein [Paenibacillus kobensis]
MIGYHDRIKRQFGRSAQGQYDSNVRVQLIMATELAERIQTHYIGGNHSHAAPARVMEIGCGTGTLTALLARTQLLSRGSITAIDISPGMLAAASRKLLESCPEAMDRIQWVEADAEQWATEYDRHKWSGENRHTELWKQGVSGEQSDSDNECQQLNAPFELIVSNACFQWFVHPARTLAALRGSLSDGGLLAFTTFGPRTMHELHTSFQQAYHRLEMPYKHHGLSFHSLSAWQNMLHDSGWRLLDASSQEQIETHRSVPDFLHTVKAIGASAASTDAQRISLGDGAGRRLFREMFQIYESLFPEPDGTGVAATYETITILAARD